MLPRLTLFIKAVFRSVCLSVCLFLLSMTLRNLWLAVCVTLQDVAVCLRQNWFCFKMKILAIVVIICTFFLPSGVVLLIRDVFAKMYVYCSLSFVYCAWNIAAKLRWGWTVVRCQMTLEGSCTMWLLECDLLFRRLLFQTHNINTWYIIVCSYVDSISNGENKTCARCMPRFRLCIRCNISILLVSWTCVL